MNRSEFIELRDLPDKIIHSDLEFTPSKFSSVSLVCEQIEVTNSLGYDLVLNGTFVPTIPSIKFNFAIKGIGAICRIEVNGKIHREAGRTHKHDLKNENCPRKNLPFAEARSDLDLSKQTPADIWQKICEESGIVHTGTFRSPI